MSDSKLTAQGKPKISRVEVYWHTVTYKPVALYVIVIAAIIGSATYLVFPETTASLVRHISESITPKDNGVATISARQGRFVNPDGEGEGKKKKTLTRTSAGYPINPDKRD